VRGWNTEQLPGQGEFYLEYGDFECDHRVRAATSSRHRLAAQAAEVLTRPAGAIPPRHPLDSGVAIIARSEAGTPATRPPPNATLTWHFSAKNVRDVAWAAAPNFIWDATGWNGILMQAYYAPGRTRLGHAIHLVRHSSALFEKWFRIRTRRDRTSRDRCAGWSTR